jgi:hypothetical protein
VRNLVAAVPSSLKDETGKPQMWELQPATSHKYLSMLQKLHNRRSANKTYFHSQAHHPEFYTNANKYTRQYARPLSLSLAVCRSLCLSRDHVLARSSSPVWYKTCGA